MHENIEELKTNGSYKQWSKGERVKSAQLTKKAEKLDWIKPRKACERCGKTEGIIELHNECYDVTLKILPEVFKRKPLYITEEEKQEINSVLEVICRGCHRKHHFNTKELEKQAP